MSIAGLPKGQRDSTRPPVRMATLGEVCEINPRLPKDHGLQAHSEVAFVPMAAVDEISATIAQRMVRPFGEVRRGYTPFDEGDVLFAKITPCMENGKVAIARDLAGGRGFGSTEFHVLRPGAALPAPPASSACRPPTWQARPFRCLSSPNNAAWSTCSAAPTAWCACGVGRVR
jgi:hypothetical protein